MNDLVSVIVPVYNVEYYIRKCLDSILANSYTNIEVILVDDGSTDNSGEICDEYLLIDHRVKVIHKNNGGLSSARNAGLDMAIGEYILFVDSDDYISHDTITVCLEKIKDVDIVQFNFFVVDENGQVKNKLSRSTTEEVFDPEEVQMALYKKSDTAIIVNAWNKLYKRNMIDNIRFVNGRNYEDNMFTSDIIDNMPRVRIIPDQLYYYVVRSESITNTDFNKKKLDRIYAIQYIANKHKGDKYEKYIMYWLVSVLFFTYLDVWNSEYSNKGNLQYKLHKKFRSAYKKCLLVNGCFWKYFIFYFYPTLFCRLYKRMKIKR